MLFVTVENGENKNVSVSEMGKTEVSNEYFGIIMSENQNAINPENSTVGENIVKSESGEVSENSVKSESGEVSENSVKSESGEVSENSVKSESGEVSEDSVKSGRRKKGKKGDSAAKQRIFELDFVRGLLIIMMFVQHFFMWLHNYYGNIWYVGRVPSALATLSTANNIFLEVLTHPTLVDEVWNLYFLLAGISLVFSNNNFKRAFGIFVFFVLYFTASRIAGMFLTYPLTIEVGMFFGYALYIFLFQLIKKFPLWFHIVLTALLAVGAVFYYIYRFDTEINIFIFIFGHRGVDTWNFLPSVFYFSLGGVLGRTVYKNRRSVLAPLNNVFIFKPVLWASKHSLLLYVVNVLIYPIIFLTLTAVINGSLL